MAITVGVVSVAVGVGIPVFYETQIDNAVKCFYFTIYIPIIFVLFCYILFSISSNVLVFLIKFYTQLQFVAG